MSTTKFRFKILQEIQKRFKLYQYLLSQMPEEVPPGQMLPCSIWLLRQGIVHDNHHIQQCEHHILVSDIQMVLLTNALINLYCSHASGIVIPLFPLKSPFGERLIKYVYINFFSIFDGQISHPRVGKSSSGMGKLSNVRGTVF